MKHLLRTIPVLFFLSSTSTIRAQTLGNLNLQIEQVTFTSTHYHSPTNRKVLSFKRRSAYFNPLNYLGAGLLFVYQNVFSEQIQADCKYQISCSEFTKQSIAQNGFVKGVLGGFNQWTECFSGALYEHPPVFRNSDNKIINYTSETAIK